MCIPTKNNAFFIVPLLALLFLSACNFWGEHAGQDIQTYSGDYRYTAGIGEFYDCKAAVKYFVYHSSEHQQIIQQFEQLGLANKEDVYLLLEGYLKEVIQIEGVDPSIEFVPSKLLSMDSTRGCKQSPQAGR